MRLLGPLHLTLLAAIGAVAIALTMLCRERRLSSRAVRLALGYGLAVNELIWWTFRYSHEGLRAANLPLQLCDVTLWATVAACITLAPFLVEFSYFAGLAGAGMALLTPNLWSPWPSYPAIYFFVAHGGIVVGVVVLVYGGISPLRRGALRRSFLMLLAYAALVSVVNWILGTNYMYLREKPASASLLDVLGPWPIYIFATMPVALGIFWLLWLPARPGKDR